MISKLGKKVVALFVVSFLIVSSFSMVASADDVRIRDRNKDRIHQNLNLKEFACYEVKVLFTDLEREIEEFETDEENTEGFEDMLSRLEEMLDNWETIDTEKLCNKECPMINLIPLLEEIKDELNTFIDSNFEEDIELIKEIISNIKEDFCECRYDCIYKYKNKKDNKIINKIQSGKANGPCIGRNRFGRK